MTKNITISFSLNNIASAAQKFVDNMLDKRVFSFEGEMGAGKTTFIAAVCLRLGVEDPTNSPTFAIVNEYITGKSTKIYHLDCYRIENIKQAIDINVEEYLHSGNICFIEWAENIKPLLPENTVRVTIEETQHKERELTILS